MRIFTAPLYTTKFNPDNDLSFNVCRFGVVEKNFVFGVSFSLGPLKCNREFIIVFDSFCIKNQTSLIDDRKVMDWLLNDTKLPLPFFDFGQMFDIMFLVCIIHH